MTNTLKCVKKHKNGQVSVALKVLITRPEHYCDELDDHADEALDEVIQALEDAELMAYVQYDEPKQKRKKKVAK